MRICANKIGTGVRVSTLLLNIRPVNMRQFASARDFDQLEGLAVAIPWGFEARVPPSQGRPCCACANRVRNAESFRVRIFYRTFTVAVAVVLMPSPFVTCDAMV